MPTPASSRAEGPASLAPPPRAPAGTRTAERPPRDAGHGHEWFRKVAHRTADLVGPPLAFGVALGSIVLWLASGPLFRFSDTWQLVINTATTIVTFLMVFLIQNAQNRDARAFHLKLDELLR